jgi:ribosomal protein S18
MAIKRKKAKVIKVEENCPFGGDPSKVDYKDVYKLKKFITPRGRILPIKIKYHP